MRLSNSKARGKSYSHYLGSKNLPQPLDKDVLDALVTRLRNGDVSVKQQIVDGHIRLATAIAARYYNPNKMDDIVSEALAATVYAVDIAAERLHDNNITPYIVSTIHSKISQFLENDHVVRVPGRTLRAKKIGPGFGVFGGWIFNATNNDDDETVKKQSLFVSTRERLAHVQQASSDAIDILNKLFKNDIERKIIEYRADGKKDPEIATLVGLSVARVHQIRTSLEERFNRLYKKPE